MKTYISEPKDQHVCPYQVIGSVAAIVIMLMLTCGIITAAYWPQLLGR
jgi:hypothetical protein